MVKVNPPEEAIPSIPINWDPQLDLELGYVNVAEFGEVDTVGCVSPDDEEDELEEDDRQLSLF